MSFYREWYTIEYWADKCWQDAKGNPIEYARLMRIFVRNQQLHTPLNTLKLK